MTLRSPPFGQDVSATDRVYAGRLVSGGRLVAEALYRRFTTNRGELEYDQDYGENVEQWIGAAMTPAEIETIPSKLTAEGRKDPRVGRLTVTVTRDDSDASAIRILCKGETKDGDTFDLALRVSDVTVELLHAKGG